MPTERNICGKLAAACLSNILRGYGIYKWFSALRPGETRAIAVLRYPPPYPVSHPLSCQTISVCHSALCLANKKSTNEPTTHPITNQPTTNIYRVLQTIARLKPSLRPAKLRRLRSSERRSLGTSLVLRTWRSRCHLPPTRSRGDDKSSSRFFSFALGEKLIRWELTCSGPRLCFMLFFTALATTWLASCAHIYA